MTATTTLLLPVVIAQPLVALIFCRYHCWLNMGSFGMTGGGWGGGGRGARTSVLVITHIFFLLVSRFLILGTSKSVAAIRARSFPNPASHRDAVPGIRPSA